jgi:glycine/D-amino acid oxidase-like deaminating enzyme
VSVPYWLDPPVESYPPLEGDETVDVAIVGGGVTGLSCARALATAGLRVRVLEARTVGGGASGRNGGFALRGGAESYPTSRARALWALSEAALGRLAELAGDAFRRVGSLRVAASEEELAAVRAEHDALAEDGFAVEWVERDELPPLLAAHFLGGLFNPPDGALEPGRWSRRLAAHAAVAGAAIAERTRATALEARAVRAGRHAVACDAVVVATDGYSDGLVPELTAAIRPARAQMLATAPLPERHFTCPVYAREGWDYWQQAPDGRLLIGGWRDAELEREFTSEDEPTGTLQARIEAFAGRLLGTRPRVTHRWAGLLGFTEDRRPLVGPLRDGVWVSAGYSGHGNVLALACGELVAEAILGDAGPELELFAPGRRSATPPLSGP